MKTTVRNLCLIAVVCIFLLSGCTIRESFKHRCCHLCIPKHFQNVEEGTVPIDLWWEEFGNDDLNRLVGDALRCNLDLKQAWHRLTQAREQACIQGASAYPHLDVTASALRSKAHGSNALGSTRLFFAGESSYYSLTPTISYEVDIWQKLQSRACAAAWTAKASREDFEATALLLSGSVVDLWLTIQEQRELYGLLQSQVDTNRTLVELLELRFSVGEASALDVYQQRQQLAATEAQVPPTLSLLETSHNSLQILLGQAPSADLSSVTEAPLPELPPFPETDQPGALLMKRPDLRAAKARLAAADHEVAAAIADRFPQLNLSLSYEFSATTWGEIFNREIGTFLANLITPIIDGGRRRHEVCQRRAITCELLNNYEQSFLNAVNDVENAIVQERYQLRFLEKLNEQIEAAQANLSEARYHYVNGLNDYLPVIAALTTYQILERRMISEKKILLATRAQLYRALGGGWTKNLCMTSCTKEYL